MQAPTPFWRRLRHPCWGCCRASCLCWGSHAQPETCWKLRWAPWWWIWGHRSSSGFARPKPRSDPDLPARDETSGLVLEKMIFIFSKFFHIIFFNRSEIKKYVFFLWKKTRFFGFAVCLIDTEFCRKQSHFFKTCWDFFMMVQKKKTIPPIWDWFFSRTIFDSSQKKECKSNYFLWWI